jgi:hypothetical protein
MGSRPLADFSYQTELQFKATLTQLARINLPLDNCLYRMYDDIHQNRHMNHGNCKETQLNPAESGYEC